MAVSIGHWGINVCAECHDEGAEPCERCDLPVHGEFCAHNHQELCGPQASQINLLGKVHKKIPDEGTALNIRALAETVLPTVMPNAEKRIINAEGKQMTLDEWKGSLPGSEPWTLFAARVGSILRNCSEFHLFVTTPLISENKLFGLLLLSADKI